MDFRKWLELQETMTSTGDVASFPMRWGPGGEIVRRGTFGQKHKKKKSDKDKK